MRIRVLGAHMFESDVTRLSSILIDNVLAIDAGGLTSSLSFPEQAAIEHILLTHGHYDHIRDVPAIALKNRHRTINILATQQTLDILTTHLTDGTIYPKFHESPTEDPSLRLTALEPYANIYLGIYEVLAIPVNHAIPSVGYQIRDSQGYTIFYSGDTGPGLATCWEKIDPQILFIETALSNRSASAALTPGHLCPSLLHQELADFKRTKGYLPEVILTHMNPETEDEILYESKEVSRSLEVDIRLAHEGMEIEVGRQRF